MDTIEIAVKMVRDAVGVMSTKFSELVKSGLDGKQDIATMPTKVSDFTNDSGFQNAQQVEDKIDAKISSAYKAGGSATLATLPALTAAKLGVVVNMSEDFTTTSDFLEGAGKTYPAGTNVVVALAGENTYKYDVLAGFVDLSGYVQNTRKVGNVPLSADIPVSITGDSAITVTNTGTASAIGYSVTHANSGVTAGSKGDASAQTPGFGGTFKALSATVDAKGHVTALSDHNVTIPSATATSQANGLMSKSDKAKLDTLSVTASNPLEVTKTGETYNVTLKDSGVTAGSKGDASAQTPGFGGTFKALSATVDAKGRLTALNEHNVKVPDTDATSSAAGLMSAADKAKLNSVEEQANKTVIDDTLTVTGNAADAKATGDVIAALRAENALLKELITGSDATYTRTATGNPAIFSDAKAANAENITVTITPTQSGSGDPSPTNIRPITGVSSVSVAQSGKNLLPLTLAKMKSSTNGGTWNDNVFTSSGLTLTVNLDGDNNVTGITVNGTSTAGLYFRFITDGLPLVSGVSYILSGCPDGGGNNSYFIYTGSYSSAGWIDDDTHKYARTYDTAWRSLHIAVRKDVTVNNLVFRPMIRLASDTDPAFEYYKGQSVTVPFVDSSEPLTVYGGTLDVTSGTLNVTHGYISSYDGETLPGVWMSDRDVYASGATPTTGAEVVYELAAPVTYNLTAAQLQTLAGYNIVSADAGTLAVKYQADLSITLGGD